MYVYMYDCICVYKVCIDNCTLLAALKSYSSNPTGWLEEISYKVKSTVVVLN